MNRGGSLLVAFAIAWVWCLSIVACGDSSDGDGQEYRIPEPRLTEMLAEASDWQRAILEDGVITFADYERAVFATVACLEDQGVEIASAPRLSARNVYEYLYAGDDPQEINAIYWECYEEHQHIIDRVWAATGQVNPTESDLAAAREAMAECLRDAGVEVRDASSEVLLELSQSDMREFWPCADRVTEEHGAWEFGG